MKQLVRRRVRRRFRQGIFSPRALPGVVLVGAICAIAPAARADGGYFSTIFRDMREPQQTALLIHDAATQREDLLLSVAFDGPDADFGWVVPVPGMPEVTEVDPRLFWECADLTEPILRDREIGCGSGAKDVAGPSDVTIYDDRQVGIYRSLVVGAANAGALADSLTRWGFLHAENRTEAEAALGFYIERGWYFALFRIDATQAPPGAERWWGRLDPVRLSFASAEPVYPLRISRVSAAERSELLLYVCAEHRMTFPGAVTEYANRISASELRAIRQRHSHLGPLLTEGRYLTKLRRVFSPAQMTEDLVLEPAERDEELRWVHYSGFPASGLLLLGLVAGWAGRRVFRRRASVSPA